MWNGTRADNLKKRWREDKERQSEGWWSDLFNKISKSPFLMGDNDRGWKADLGWIVKRENLVKIIEGRYTPGKPDLDCSYGTGKTIL